MRIIGFVAGISRPWEDLSMDLIFGLPAYRDHTSILVVVVDRFSKGTTWVCYPYTIMLI